jgi:hypothetical protein
MTVADITGSTRDQEDPMHAHVSTPSILATIAVAVSVHSAPHFSLASIGAVAVTAASGDAQYEITPASVNGRPVLAISLGGREGPGSLLLYLDGEQLPTTGRYPIRSSWSDQESGRPAFHAGFAAGTPEHPLGWFHGESGSVTITRSAPGRMSGRFDILARGYLAADPDNENQWVRLRGSFDAADDGSMQTIAGVQ